MIESIGSLEAIDLTLSYPWDLVADPTAPRRVVRSEDILDLHCPLVDDIVKEEEDEHVR